jgi:hypothetical protein
MVWFVVALPVVPAWRPTNSTKWMTLPGQSGNMSQLYRGFFPDSMIAKLAGATIVASI